MGDDDAEEPGSSKPNESLHHAIKNLVSIIDEPLDDPSPVSNQPSVVHIIGTGLCPSLLDLPLSTLHVLSRADVVLCDALGLSQRDISRIVPEYCEVIHVGKRGDEKSWKQADIDGLLLQMATTRASPASSVANDEPSARNTKVIVRLKGGDPFLFGRTRTEVEALRSRNVPYSYTPGISSCIAGPHLGGIPLTDPSSDCQSFGVWSGTDAFGRSWGFPGEKKDTGRDRKWKGLEVDTLVFLMIGRLDKLEVLCCSIADNVSLDDDVARSKWHKGTPCAVIHNAGGRNDPGDTTLPVQRVWRSTLGNIVADIKKDDETRTSVSPAVFVVGATAALDLLLQDSRS